MKETLSGKPPEIDASPAPGPIDPATGMHTDYWVLSEAERAAGYVRPYRDRYRHVGIRPKHPTRPLTDEEKERHGKGYVAFEEYPPEEAPKTGRFWTQAQLNSGCGAVTTMHRKFAETYAAQPSFYGSTFCATCGAHFPVGEGGEFVWLDDGTKVGT